VATAQTTIDRPFEPSFASAPVNVGPLVGNCWRVSSSALCTGEVDVFEAASVLTNEFALADVALAPAQFRALFAGALRASR
jgi:hypothetical protein